LGGWVTQKNLDQIKPGDKFGGGGDEKMVRLVKKMSLESQGQGPVRQERGGMPSTST